MTIEELRNFCTVAKFKNISRAADSLYMSSSSLSRHMSMLEESLGVELIKRDARSISLTETGMYVFQNAPKIIETFDCFEENIRQFYLNQRRTIVLAAPPFFNSNFIGIYQRYHQTNINQQLTLKTMPSWEIIYALLHHEADLGLTYDFELDNSPAQLEMFPLFKEELAVLVYQGHPFSSCSSVTIDDIAKENLLSLYRPTDPHMSFFSRLGEKLPEPTTQKSQSDPQQVAFQVKAGIGIAIFPQSMCNEYSAGCVIVPICEKDSATKMILIRNESCQNQAALEFYDFICSQQSRLQ